MISIYMFKKVRDLKDQGLSNRKIASQLGIDRKTVAAYVSGNAPPKYGPRKRGGRRPDPFEDFEGLLASLTDLLPNLTAREIFISAKEYGYQGSIRTVARRLAALKSKRPKERFFDQEYEPGEQAQFDFKESVELPFIDGPRIVHFHFGTLPFSDFFGIKGYPLKTYEAFMDGVHSFFETTGGMTEKIRFDNLSPCVRKVLKGNQRLYTQAFERATAYYGFDLLPCSPGKGSDKGDVERDIRTHAQTIKNRVKITGKVFRDYGDLNSWLADYCVQYRLPKVGPLFEKEQQTLKPLPRRDEDILCKVETTTATAFGTVAIAKSTYSVPDCAIGMACRIVASPFEVKIYRSDGKGELLATHERRVDGSSSIPLEHVLPSLIRKPRAMVRWSHRGILFPNKNFTKYYEHLKKRCFDSAEREYLRSINLVQYTTLAEIGVGMELVLETIEKDLSVDPFIALKELLLGPDRRPPTTTELIAEQVPLCPMLSDYDSLIPQLLETGT